MLVSRSGSNGSSNERIRPYIGTLYTLYTSPGRNQHVIVVVGRLFLRQARSGHDQIPDMQGHDQPDRTHASSFWTVKLERSWPETLRLLPQFQVFQTMAASANRTSQTDPSDPAVPPSMSMPRPSTHEFHTGWFVVSRVSRVAVGYACMGGGGRSSKLDEAAVARKTRRGS